MNLTDADVQEIIRLLDDSDYDELEIETERFRLVLRRGAAGQRGWSQQRETLARPNRDGAPSATMHSAVSGEANFGKTTLVHAALHTATHADSGAAEAVDDGLAAIRSPIIGTFYRAPRPGADPFVKSGSRVGPDTVVAIIEVMKLMNSVSAGLDGEVVEVLVEDGQLVQKGQCLMRVRPISQPPGELPE